MFITEKKEQAIDMAWERLYERLACDNLLTDNAKHVKQTVFRSVGFRWAACIAILCVSILSVWLLRPQPGNLLVIRNDANAPTLATTLEDGSIIYLSEQASIHYPEHFQDYKRVVTLQGNASFEVSKQPERPFYVHTGVVEIEVLGTFFHVKNSDSPSFSLSVSHGEVKVTLKATNQVMHVNAGEAISLSSGALTKTGFEPVQNGFSKIRFKDERLADVARIINLNSFSTPIEISPGLENRQLTFDYSGETPEEVAMLISMALDLHFSQQQTVITITK